MMQWPSYAELIIANLINNFYKQCYAYFAYLCIIFQQSLIRIIEMQWHKDAWLCMRKKYTQNVRSLLWHKVIVLGGQPCQFSLPLSFGRTLYLQKCFQIQKWKFFFHLFCLVSTIDFWELWSFDVKGIPFIF